MSFVQQRFARQLGVIAGSMGAMLLLTAVVALVALQQVLSAAESRAHAQAQQQLAYQLRSDVQDYTAALLDMAWTRRDRRDDLELFTQNFARDMAKAQAVANSPEQSSLLQGLGTQYTAYQETADQIVQFNLAGRSSDAAVQWVSGEAQAGRTGDIAQRYYRIASNQAAQAQQQAYDRGQLALIALLVSVVAALIIGSVAATLMSRRVVATLGQLTRAAQRMAAGDTTPVAVVAQDELGVLAHAFNGMAADLSTQRAAQQQWNQQLEQQVADRTTELQSALDQQQLLTDTVRAMSTPVLPVLHGVLVLPLVGILDTERVEQAQATLLRAVEQQHAHTVILDITGIPMVDTHVARCFVAIAQQSRLLGAQCMLVGISPEVAQTMVGLGIDLGNLRTLSDLGSAIMSLTPTPKAQRRAA